MQAFVGLAHSTSLDTPFAEKPLQLALHLQTGNKSAYGIYVITVKISEQNLIKCTNLHDGSKHGSLQVLHSSAFLTEMASSVETFQCFPPDMPCQYLHIVIRHYPERINK